MFGVEYISIPEPIRETDGLLSGLSLYFEPITLFLRGLKVILLCQGVSLLFD
jgi:hypothetical protein